MIDSSNLIMLLTCTFLVSIDLVVSVDTKYLSVVALYEDKYFMGKEIHRLNLHEVPYISLSKLQFDKILSSFAIINGSCIELHMNDPPNYDKPNEWFFTTHNWHFQIRDDFDNKVSSIKACDVDTTVLHCPDGQFVKSMAWDNSKNLSTGVEVHCYEPRSAKPDTILRSHGDEKLPQIKECTAYRGFDFVTSSRKGIYIGFSPVCAKNSPIKNDVIESSLDDRDTLFGHTEFCSVADALRGVKFDVEQNSGFIKGLFAICEEIGSAAANCNPEDRESTLWVCDNSQSLGQTDCSHSKTIGTGYKAQTTQTDLTERTFYEEFGFELSLNFEVLSTNFKTKLGLSQTTGYSWASTSESTFHESTTTTILAKVQPGAITTLLEIIGTCGFMESKPNYFKRIDKFPNGTMALRSDVVITQEDMVRGFVNIDEPKEINKP